MKPAIEPILELRKVALCILGAKGMIRAAKRALDVPQNRIDPMKFGMLRTGTPASRHHSVMGTPRIGHGMKTRQPIGEYSAAFAQVLASPYGEFDAAEFFDDRELHALRMAPVVGPDGGDEGSLSGRPATGLPPPRCPRRRHAPAPEPAPRESGGSEPVRSVASRSSSDDPGPRATGSFLVGFTPSLQAHLSLDKTSMVEPIGVPAAFRGACERDPHLSSRGRSATDRLRAGILIGADRMRDAREDIGHHGECPVIRIQPCRRRCAQALP